MKDSAVEVVRPLWSRPRRRCSIMVLVIQLYKDVTDLHRLASLLELKTSADKCNKTSVKNAPNVTYEQQYVTCVARFFTVCRNQLVSVVESTALQRLAVPMMKDVATKLIHLSRQHTIYAARPELRVNLSAAAEEFTTAWQESCLIDRDTSCPKDEPDIGKNDLVRAPRISA